MLRRLYYLLPAPARLWARRIVFFPRDILRKTDPLVPPQGMIYTGSGDFRQQGRDMVALFRQWTNLNAQSQVLDVGSGIGRMAVAMTDFLKAPYCGFDAVLQGVQWCQNAITSRFPNFEFTYVDLYNDLYKSGGQTAAIFKFPYQNNRFDFSCAISVYTHMLPDETANYLQETARVLAPGGQLFATFFVYNEADTNRLSENADFKFPFIKAQYALMDAAVQSANVAYSRQWLLDITEKAGLTLVREELGLWSNPQLAKGSGARFQDILIWEKR